MPSQLGTNPQKTDRKGKGKAQAKEDELVAPTPLGLVDGSEDDEDVDEDAEVPWIQPPGYIDVVSQAHSQTTRQAPLSHD